MEVVSSCRFAMYQTRSRGYALKWAHTLFQIKTQENKSRGGHETDTPMDELGQNPTKPKTIND